MIGRLVTQILAYVAVGLFLSLVWVVLGHGTTEDLREFVAAPSTALTTEYWPIVWWLGGGLLVAMSLARTIGRILRPSTWSRQLRRTRELEAQGIPRAEAILTAADEHTARRGHRRWQRGKRLLTVLFTDISGSTSLNEELGDDVWARVVNEHRTLVRDATQRFGGTEVATQGDGFFMRFDDAPSAVRCAIDIQRRLAHQRAGDALVPPVRIGIHSGEAIHGDDDVLGQVVNIGARLMEVADHHDVIITEPVVDRGELPVPAEDRGLVSLKGMAQRRHVLALCWQEPDAAAGV